MISGMSIGRAGLPSVGGLDLHCDLDGRRACARDACRPGALPALPAHHVKQHHQIALLRTRPVESESQHSSPCPRTLGTFSTHLRGY